MRTNTEIIYVDNQTANNFKITLSGRVYTAFGVTEDHVLGNVSTPEDDPEPVVSTYNVSLPKFQSGSNIGEPTALIDEGETYTVSTSTTNVSEYTTLYWKVNSNFTDFAVPSGSFVVNDNIGNFDLTTLLDETTEGSENFTISIKTGSITGTTVATTPTITILDTSLTPPLPKSYFLTPYYVDNNIAHSRKEVDEGESLLIGVTTINVDSGTVLYYTCDSTDIRDGNGTVTIQPIFTEALGVANFYVTPIVDEQTEGPETFTVQLRLSSFTGPVVASTDNITILDTSQSPQTESPELSGETPPSSPTVAPAPQIAPDIVESVRKDTNTVEIFANFDTTAIIDPERLYYNLPKNELPVLNQVSAATKLLLNPNPPVDKIVFSTNGIDGYGYNDNTFNFDKKYFQNQIIYFTARIKTVTNYPAKHLNNLTLGDGSSTTIKIELLDENNNTLQASVSSDMGILSADTLGGFFKGSFQYDGVGNNLKLKGTTSSTLKGESNTFNILPVSAAKDFRKLNEDNNQKDNFLDYLYQPNLKNNPKFFTDIIGQIVGDDSNPNTLGVKVYEKISNFLLNSSDIDFANIDNLIGNLKLIDSNVNKFSSNYPASLKRIVDFFSVNRSKIIPVKNNFNQDFDDEGRPSSNKGKNLGNKIDFNVDILSGGESYKPIVAYEKFSKRYKLLNTDPTSAFDFRYLGNNKTFSLSSYNTRWGWGLVLPGGTGDYEYLKDESGDNLLLEDGLRILNENKGLPTSEIPNYYTFFEYISTVNGDNVFSFYDDTNISSTCNLNTLSSIDDSIDDILLKDLYSGTNLIV
jgi:hypothetical protein